MATVPFQIFSKISQNCLKSLPIQILKKIYKIDLSQKIILCIFLSNWQKWYLSVVTYYLNTYLNTLLSNLNVRLIQIIKFLVLSLIFPILRALNPFPKFWGKKTLLSPVHDTKFGNLRFSRILCLLKPGDLWKHEPLGIQMF